MHDISSKVSLQLQSSALADQVHDALVGLVSETSGGTPSREIVCMIEDLIKILEMKLEVDEQIFQIDPNDEQSISIRDRTFSFLDGAKGYCDIFKQLELDEV